jgi:F-type H+-transporting ATPase subunit b
MIALNFTLVVQLLLFLLFLYVTNKVVIRPLLKTMDARSAKVEEDLAAAGADSREAERVEADVKDRLTGIHQEEALRLRKARHDEYQKNRRVLDELKHRANAAVDAYRVQMDRRVEEERRNYPQLVPSIVEAMDRQVNTEGYAS